MHHGKSHIPSLLVHYFHNKEMDELYLSVFLKGLALSMISIFVPIYLLELGFGILDIAFYYLMLLTLAFFVMPVGMYLNQFFGVKKTIGIASIIYVCQFILLYAVQNGVWYGYAAIVSGISNAIYYSAFHLVIAKSVDKKAEGEEYSLVRGFIIGASIIGPLLGAVVFKILGMGTLTIIVSLIFITSALPLFFTKDYKIKFGGVSFNKVRSADSKRKGLAYFLSGMIGLVGWIFWPTFIYLTLKNVVSLGFIVTLSSLFLIIVYMYVGKLADKNPKKVLVFGIFTHSPIWILRLFLLSPFGLLVSNFTSAATNTCIELPFLKSVYGKAGKVKNKAHFFLFRELYLWFGRITILGAIILTQNILWLFVISSIATIGYSILLKEI